MVDEMVSGGGSSNKNSILIARYNLHENKLMDLLRIQAFRNLRNSKKKCCLYSNCRIKIQIVSENGSKLLKIISLGSMNKGGSRRGAWVMM